MIIIGCDYHPGFQQIAYVNTDTGDLSEERLGHKEQSEQFYQNLRTRGLTVRVGMEASGHARWFERLLNELQVELWIGDAAAVRTKRVRKQKTDRQDAQLLLRLLVENRFPRIWMPDAENRDLRQLLWHRHRLVQMRTRVMNQLHVVALNEGLRHKKALWRRGPGAVGIVSPGSVGQPTPPGPARLARSVHAEDPGTNQKVGRGGEEATSGSATPDPSWSGSADRAGVRVSHWHARTFPVRETNRQLCGTGAVGRVQWRSATTGPHQQTGQHSVAFLARGSGAGHGAQRSAMAQPVLSPRHAARAKDRESSDGPETGGRVVLDVAARMARQRNAAARFTGSKIRLSCRSTHCFDLVPEAAKFPNHSISAPAS